jgi:hypothetical protein
MVDQDDTNPIVEYLSFYCAGIIFQKAAQWCQEDA